MGKIDVLNIPLFNDLEYVHKSRLLGEFTQKSYKPGELLFEEGEFGDSLYIILQGEVRIFLQSDGDRTLAILKEREYFGEMSLLTGDPRSAAAQAVSELVVLRLSRDKFESVMLKHNALAVQFAGILARRLAAVNRGGTEAQSPGKGIAARQAETRREEKPDSEGLADEKGESPAPRQSWRSRLFGWPLPLALALAIGCLIWFGGMEKGVFADWLANGYLWTAVAFAIGLQWLARSGIAHRLGLIVTARIGDKPSWMKVGLRRLLWAGPAALPVLTVSSSLMLWFGLSLTSSGEGMSSFSFVQWMLLTSPLVLLWLLCALLLDRNAGEGEGEAEGDTSMNGMRLAHLGSWTWPEKLAAIAVPAMVGLLLAAPALGMSPLWIGIGFLAVSGMAGGFSKEIALEQPWAQYISFVLLGGLWSALDGVAWFEGSVVGAEMMQWPPLAVLLLALAIAAFLGWWLPSLPAMWLAMMMCGPVLSGSEENGLIVIASLLLVLQVTSKLRETGGRAGRRVLFGAAAAMIAAAIVYPLWTYWGLAQGGTAASGLIAAEEKNEAVNVIVRLSIDESLNESAREGIELAIRKRGLPLSPAYLYEGEPVPEGLLARSAFGISVYGHSAAALPPDIPWLTLHGGEKEASDIVDWPPGHYAAIALDELIKSRSDSFVIYYEATEDGRQFANALEKAAAAKGLALVDRLQLLESEDGLSSFASNWRMLGVNAVIVYARTDEAAAGLSKRLEAQGTGIEVIGPIGAYPGNGMAGSELVSEQEQAFLQAYREGFGHSPDRTAAAAYDAVNLLAEAYKSAAESSGSAGEANSAGMASPEVWDGALRRYVPAAEGLSLSNKEESGKEAEK